MHEWPCNGDYQNHNIHSLNNSISLGRSKDDSAFTGEWTSVAPVATPTTRKILTSTRLDGAGVPVNVSEDQTFAIERTGLFLVISIAEHSKERSQQVNDLIFKNVTSCSTHIHVHVFKF